MAKGSFSKAFTPYSYKVIVEWSSKANNSTNSSVITADIYLDVVYTLRTSAHSGSKITINGVEYPFDSPTINADGDKVFIATITSNAIKHGDNGKKSVSISCDYAVNATISGTYYGTITASDTVDLDLIPRQATLTAAPNFDDEDNPEITYSNPAGNAVDSLQAAIYDSEGSVAYAAYRNITKTASTYTFNLTTAERNALRNAIPNSKSMTVKFYVKTVIGSNTYYSSISKTLSIVNANPTINPTIEDTDSKTLALTGDKNKLVRYYSNAKITIGAAAIKGATLSSSEVSCNGKSLTADGTLNNIGSGVFTFTAKDSRGNSTTKTVNPTTVNYVKLTAIFKPTITVDGMITFTISGNYFNGTFGAVNNELALSYRYKAADGEYGDWQTVVPSLSGHTYECDVSFTIPDFNYRSNYTFQVSAADKLVSLNPEYVASALPVFDWSKDDFNFNVPVSAPSFNGFTLGRNKLLWQGGHYMTANQTAELSEAVSAQGSGIVLVFSRYYSGDAANEHFCYFYVPKYIVEIHEDKGSIFTMATSNETYAASKYLYISDTSITGHENNSASGTGATGVKYDNSAFVLRYVIGV